MKYENLKEIIANNKKGTYSNIMWGKSLKTLKAYSTNNLSKVTKGVVRLGVTYDNMGSVQTKRENGTLPSENQGLPFGEWDMFPYTIKHKGETYLRVSLDRTNKLDTSYFMNGNATTRDIVKPMCQASEFPQNATSPDVLTINIKNIIDLK